jgi:uridine kinase
MMKKDIFESNKVVISGSLVDWGDDLISDFTLAVRVITDSNVRIERLREREKRHFGSRIENGGDMYQNHLEFIEWAASYDTGDVNTRSKAKHDEWQKLLKCRQIVVNGEDNLKYNLELIKKALLLD